jgi:hypothetical protein
MTDVAAAAREYVAAPLRTPAVDVARELDCTEAGAMAAVSDALPELPEAAFDDLWSRRSVA